MTLEGTYMIGAKRYAIRPPAHRRDCGGTGLSGFLRHRPRVHLRLGSTSLGMDRFRSLPGLRPNGRARRSVSNDGSAVGVRLLSRRVLLDLWESSMGPAARAGGAERLDPRDDL